jgi:hypothetical protein
MRGRVPAPLAILLAVATIQFLAWMLVLPAVQAPDEHTHFAYTQRLMETGHKPPLSGDQQRYSPELEAAWTDAGLRPLIGNLSARPYWTALDERLWRRHDGRLGPDARDFETGASGASHNPPLYYAYAGIAYAIEWNGSFFDRLYAMRLANLPLYLITVVMTWILAGQLLGKALWPRTVAAGVVAVQPQLAFVVAGISPDPMLTAIWAVFLVAAVAVVQRGVTVKNAAGLVALSLASVATHPRGAPLAILAVLALGLGLRTRAGRISRRTLALGGAAAAAILVVALLVIVTRAGVLDTTEGAGFNPREFASYVWQFYLPRLPFMNDSIGPDYGVQGAFVDTFYGVFASLEVRWSPLVYQLLAAASLIGLVALITTLVRARATLPKDLLALLVAAPLVLVAALHFAAYRNLQLDPENPVIVGRYLFPVIPVFGVAVAIVVRALRPRASIALGTALLLTGALLGLSGLGMTAVRFYV